MHILKQSKYDQSSVEKREFPMSTVLLTNIIPPYRIAVYEDLSRKLGGEIIILTCASMEKGRYWQPGFGDFEQHTLGGCQVNLGGGRVIHLNQAVWRTLRRIKPSSIITTGFGPTMIVAFLFCKLRRIPHGLIMDGTKESDDKWVSFLHRIIRKIIIRRSAFGIAASTGSALWFQSYGMDSKSIFPSPLVPAWQSGKPVVVLEKRRTDILWCGNIDDSRKGAFFFLDVVQRLSCHLPGLSVRVVGEGPLKQFMKKALGEMDVRYRMEGHMEKDQLIEAFETAKLFLFPSRSDCWGLVANEAAQSGTPIIISKHAGASELFAETELVLDLKVEDWVKLSRELLSDTRYWSEVSTKVSALVCNITVDAASEGYFRAINYVTKRPNITM